MNKTKKEQSMKNVKKINAGKDGKKSDKNTQAFKKLAAKGKIAVAGCPEI
jgi:hypothetical protein